MNKPQQRYKNIRENQKNCKKNPSRFATGRIKREITDKSLMEPKQHIIK